MKLIRKSSFFSNLEFSMLKLRGPHATAVLFISTRSIPSQKIIDGPNKSLRKHHPFRNQALKSLKTKWWLPKWYRCIYSSLPPPPDEKKKPGPSPIKPSLAPKNTFLESHKDPRNKRADDDDDDDPHSGHCCTCAARVAERSDLDT